jgi:hypothetical protein
VAAVGHRGPEEAAAAGGRQFTSRPSAHLSRSPGRSFETRCARRTTGLPRRPSHLKRGDTFSIGVRLRRGIHVGRMPTRSRAASTLRVANSLLRCLCGISVDLCALRVSIITCRQRASAPASEPFIAQVRYRERRIPKTLATPNRIASPTLSDSEAGTEVPAYGSQNATARSNILDVPRHPLSNAMGFVTSFVILVVFVFQPCDALIANGWGYRRSRVVTSPSVAPTTP